MMEGKSGRVKKEGGPMAEQKAKTEKKGRGTVRSSAAQMPKYIFVTGGVLSGVGKGITAASIGAILKAKGFKVSLY